MDWNQWRAQFPITTTGITHLNHAGIAPLSMRVVQAVTSFAQEATAVDAVLQNEWKARCEAARAGFARLVGARAEEIAFVKNTSEGLSLVAAGIDWLSGDNVVGVNNEYPSNVYPWFALRRWGVDTRLVTPATARLQVSDIAAAADARTRVVAVSFVDWNSGARTDLASIGEWCRARGILFCVDGIQGVGAVQLDVERSGIDCLAVGGHKWLLAPEGCGCLYVSRRVADRVHSVLHGWKSVSDADTYLPYHFEPRPDAAKFEPGSPSILGTLALGAAIELLLEIGAARVEERLRALTDQLADGLRARGARILSPWEPDARSGIVVFGMDEDPLGLCAALVQRQIIVRVRGGGIRVAPHFYNDENDIQRLLAAVDELA